MVQSCEVNLTVLHMDVPLQVKTSYAAHVLTAEAARALNAISAGGDAYGRLSASIAPEIFGHEDVKKVSWGTCNLCIYVCVCMQYVAHNFSLHIDSIECVGWRVMGD